jgi:hypothetical protein
LIQYLTGQTGAYLEDGIAAAYNIGLMIQPVNAYHNRVHRYSTWAADNGAFSNFNPVKFRKMLTRPNVIEHKGTCSFVVAPDVMGDASATLKLFPTWALEIYPLGFPIALVAQDGLERLLDYVSWDLVDVLFVGGTTSWKLSSAARECVKHAQALGKRTHMGRVNSLKRLTLAHSWGIDSADGTFLAYGPDINLPQLLHWLEKLNGKESGCAA